MSTSQRRRWRAEEKLRILEEARQADQLCDDAKWVEEQGLGELGFAGGAAESC